jgi:hypothetical protein
VGTLDLLLVGSPRCQDSPCWLRHFYFSFPLPLPSAGHPLPQVSPTASALQSCASAGARTPAGDAFMPQPPSQSPSGCRGLWWRFLHGTARMSARATPLPTRAHTLHLSLFLPPLCPLWCIPCHFPLPPSSAPHALVCALLQGAALSMSAVSSLHQPCACLLAPSLASPLPPPPLYPLLHMCRLPHSPTAVPLLHVVSVPPNRTLWSCLHSSATSSSQGKSSLQRTYCSTYFVPTCSTYVA